jgi:hypothetical protein
VCNDDGAAMRMTCEIHLSLYCVQFISRVHHQTPTLNNFNSAKSWLDLEFWSGAAPVRVGAIPNRV